MRHIAITFLTAAAATAVTASTMATAAHAATSAISLPAERDFAGRFNELRTIATNKIAEARGSQNAPIKSEEGSVVIAQGVQTDKGFAVYLRKGELTVLDLSSERPSWKSKTALDEDIYMLSDNRLLRVLKFGPGENDTTAEFREASFPFKDFASQLNSVIRDLPRGAKRDAIVKNRSLIETEILKGELALTDLSRDNVQVGVSETEGRRYVVISAHGAFAHRVFQAARENPVGEASDILIPMNKDALGQPTSPANLKGLDTIELENGAKYHIMQAF